MILFFFALVGSDRRLFDKKKNLTDDYYPNVRAKRQARASERANNDLTQYWGNTIIVFFLQKLLSAVSRERRGKIAFFFPFYQMIGGREQHIRRFQFRRNQSQIRLFSLSAPSSSRVSCKLLFLSTFFGDVT